MITVITEKLQKQTLKDDPLQRAPTTHPMQRLTRSASQPQVSLSDRLALTAPASDRRQVTPRAASDVSLDRAPDFTTETFPNDTHLTEQTNFNESHVFTGLDQSASPQTPPMKRRCRSHSSPCKIRATRAGQRLRQPVVHGGQDAYPWQPHPSSVWQPHPSSGWQPHPSSVWQPVGRRHVYTRRSVTPLYSKHSGNVCSTGPDLWLHNILLAAEEPRDCPRDVRRACAAQDRVTFTRSVSSSSDSPSPRPLSASSGFYDSSSSSLSAPWADTPSTKCDVTPAGGATDEFNSFYNSWKTGSGQQVDSEVAMLTQRAGDADDVSTEEPPEVHHGRPRCRSQPSPRMRSGLKRRRAPQERWSGGGPARRPSLNFLKMTETAYKERQSQTDRLHPVLCPSAYGRPDLKLTLNPIASSPVSSGATTPCTGLAESRRSPTPADDAPPLLHVTEDGAEGTGPRDCPSGCRLRPVHLCGCDTDSGLEDEEVKQARTASVSTECSSTDDNEAVLLHSEIDLEEMERD